MFADLRFEHHEALYEGCRAKAAWILFLHFVAIARALTFDRTLALVERARRIVGLGS